MAEIKIILDAFTQEKSLDGSIAKLQKVIDLSERINANKIAINSSISTADTAKLVIETEKLIKAKEREAKATEASTKAVKTQSLEEIKLRIQEQERIKSLKQVAREELGLVSLYQKQSMRLVYLTRAYKDLELAQRQNGKVARGLKAEIDILDKSLKGADANTGKFVRNVGNYKSGFDGLQNSINQITRELPAFTNSMQTGFMAISNNLPILADNIQRIREQNKELMAQGLPTESVLKQLSSSFLSWGTALSVGITLLTVYGEQIVKTIDELITFDEALFRSQKRWEHRKQLILENIKIDQLWRSESLVSSRLFLDVLEAQFATEAVLYKKRKDLLFQEQDDILRKIQENLNETQLLQIKSSDTKDEEQKKAIENEIKQKLDEYDTLIYERDRFHNKEAILDANYAEIRRRAAIKNKEREIELTRNIDAIFFGQKMIQIENETRILLAQEDERYKEELRNAKIQGEKLELVEKEHQKNMMKIVQDAAEQESEIELERLAKEQKKRLEKEIRIRKTTEEYNINKEKEGSLRRLNYQIEAIEIERDVLLTNAHLTEIERQRIIQESEQKIRDLRQKFLNEQISAIQQASNAIVKRLTEDSDKRAALINKEISREEKKIDRQQELADKGLSNTLAFEEKKKAELERSAIEEQKKKEKIKKIEAFFNLFSEYAKEDPKTALPKSIRDIALATAFSTAFAEEGGVVEDIAKPVKGGRIDRGIFVGRSHRQGGIHLEAEGSEGILSKKEMMNLGKENFYSLKELSKRPVDDGLFERQNAAFIRDVPIIYNNANKELTSKVDELIEVVKNKEEFNYKGFTKDFKYMVTELKKNGNKTVTKYKF